MTPSSNPYHWPYDSDGSTPLDPSRMAVVACGMQSHWVDQIHRCGVAVERIYELIDELRARGVTVLWVRHTRTALALRPIDRFLPARGTPQWELLVRPHPPDIVIDTPGHDAFLVGNVEIELRSRGIDRLVMVGLGSETTVSGTLRSANDRGFECLTVTDAVAHHDPITGVATLSSITMSGGIFGAIAPITVLLAGLDGSTADAPGSAAGTVAPTGTDVDDIEREALLEKEPT